MTSVVESSATIDDESTSNTLKRRRSSTTNSNEIDIDETPFKRVCTSSSINNLTSDTNNVPSMFTCLNNIVQYHRNLVREYVDLQMCDRPDLSLDEQRFIQAEEDLIEKVEKNLHDTNNIPSTPPSRNGKRQRYQSINFTNQSFDRVKHETHILKRIDELKSDGKWTNQRLGKCLEPNKRKTHWDYLLDEMRWLAEDFELEKRWKQAMARKLSLAVLKYFRDKQNRENQQQREEIKRLRKQAQFMCREVMNFWKNIHKIAEYKTITRSQQLRKYQLDLHLNIIVDQTEKYSDWLVQSLRKSSGSIRENEININADSDMNEETDDEETIEREEQNEPDEYDLNEIQELKDGQEESLDSLLRRHYGIDLSNPSSEKENNYLEEEEVVNNSNDNQLSETSDEEFPDDEINPSMEQSITTDKQMDDLALTAESLQPTGFTLNTTSVKIPVPFLLKHSLREYQHVGLDWLVTLYENKLNCILADEMGLGKTIQTIALLAHLACEKGIWGPHLIVVPTSVMLNWEVEFKKWCPAFKILTYYGSVRERQLKRQGWTNVNAFHICITSYKLILQDVKCFRRKKWKYLILDEAQNIKNFKSQRWQTLVNFHSQRRLLLTGTPLQNSLMELWSLMHFLMPNLFASHENFREWFSNPLTEMIEQGQTSTNDSIIKRLHKILRPFILRRLKIDVEKQMPKKHEHILMCHLSKRQRELYEDFIQCQSTRNTIQQGHYMSIINILMQLRKVCNHPDLFESRPIISPFVFQKHLITCEIPELITDIDLKNPYLSLNSSLNDAFFSYRIQFILQATKEMIMNANNNDYDYQEKFHLTTDIIERYRDSTLWFQTNGKIRNLRNRSNIKSEILIEPIKRQFPSDDIYDEICKQREEERLTRYELLCQINVDRCQSHPLYGSDLLTQIESAMNPCRSSNRTRFNGYTLCQRVHELLITTRDYMSTTDTLRTLIKSNRERFDEFKDILDRFILCTTRVLAFPVELSGLNGIHITSKTIQEKPLIEVISSTDFDVLSSMNEIKQNMFLQFPERRLIQYDCGKLQTLDRLLSDLKHEKHRCLIFTQMTKMLDILENFLNHQGHTYLRLDGSTPVLQRQLLMERFNSDEKIFVFILSTRAGGIGVNLTGADTVIFYDSDWNPTMDAQAQDRCHRIGQTKDVHIYRLISKNTIEENILKKANQKRLLSDLTIDAGSFDISYFKKNKIRELFDQSSTIEDIVRERNEYQAKLDGSRSLNTTDDNLTVTQFEETLASLEDESDRQAANELTNELITDLSEFNEDETNDEQLIEKQKINNIEDELQTLDNQLRPIERYVLRCVESNRDEDNLAQINSNTYFDTEQIRKDWHLSRLKALKEQEEKQFEEEDDEMMYTYARDNERKVKYNYTYSCARNSLVASEITRHKKSFSTGADRQSTFSSFLSLSSVLFSTPTPTSSSSLSFSPSLSSDEILQQHRHLKIVPSPPHSPTLSRRQKSIVKDDLKQRTSSHNIESRQLNNHGKCTDSIICFHSNDEVSNIHSNTSDHLKEIGSSRRYMTRSSLKLSNAITSDTKYRTPGNQQQSRKVPTTQSLKQQYL
ncbi:hypothetical protein I4U23_030490 [Adineta vaga]|nr:hypothetical protein I4U23_030490 [Adineta vaga]